MRRTEQAERGEAVPQRMNSAFVESEGMQTSQRSSPRRYNHLHSPRPHHELCISLSQLPPPNAAAWASQPTKDVFIALT